MKRDYLDIAQKFNTPLYVFDTDEFERRANHIKDVLGDKVNICYSIKANPFLLYRFPEVFSNLEVCSPGELTICEKMNVDMSTIIFSGVNKEQEDVDRAMDDGVGVFTAESLLHMELIENAASQRGIIVPVLLRLTSGSQFGMDEDAIKDIIGRREKDYPHTNIEGIHFFSGTQKKKSSVIEKELKMLDEFLVSIKEELGYEIQSLEYGPGLNVDYFGSNSDETEENLLNEVAPFLRETAEKYDVTVEMGRFFAATSGVHLTKVMDIKNNHDCNYVICDSGINQLHYDGQIKGMQTPQISHFRKNDNEQTAQEERYVLCGSLCTTADILTNYNSTGIEIGDILAFHRVGAYSIYEGMSHFLSRKLPGVVMISDDEGAIEVRKLTETSDFNMP